VSDEWQNRAHAANDRRDRLKSFGANAVAVLARTRHGLFAVNPEDSGVSAALLNHGSYGDDELAFNESLISPDSNVLVVGTHIGSLAIPLARRCARLVGIEANPHSFELVQANALLNRSDNVTLHHVAAGQADGGTVEFLLSRDNSGGSKIKPAQAQADYMYDSPDVVQLPTARLDTLLGEQTFDLIIMDIEGSETFALRGMPSILTRCKVLAVEFRTHHLVDVANVAIDEFIDAVVPFFERLYVPDSRTTYQSADVADALRRMFAANECHDAIYFSKGELLPAG
jgi:FkbM family methyltransferase